MVFGLYFTWYKFYKITKKKQALIPLFLPILFLGFLVFIKIQRNTAQNVVSFLDASGEGLSIELRVDSTYRIREYGEFSAYSYYGNFQLSSDTIKLAKPFNPLGQALNNGEKMNGIRFELIDSISKENIIEPWGLKSPILLIKKNTIGEILEQKENGDFIFQLNSKGMIIKNTMIFKVGFDNRK